MRRASTIAIAQLATAGVWPPHDPAARDRLDGMVREDADSYNRFYAALALSLLEQAAAEGPESRAGASWEVSLMAALRVQEAAAARG